MVAVWKRTAFVAVGELRQADGAVVERTAVCGGGGGVSEGGKGFENGRVKAFFLVSGGGGKWVTGEETAAAAAAEVEVGAKENDDDYK